MKPEVQNPGSNMQGPHSEIKNPKGRVKILYLEDDDVDRRAFHRMVREKGLPYDITTTATLAEARAQLAHPRFDVIIADYHLPDGHSTELFAEVHDTPFVLLTGTLEENLALRTLERGADDYLPKTADQRHLEALPFTIEKTLHRKLLRDREGLLTEKLIAAEAHNRLQAAALEAAPNAISLSKTDVEGTIIWVNSAFARLTGYTPEEVLGQSHRVLHSGLQDPAFYRNLWETIQRGEVWRGELINRRKDGTLYHEEMGITPMRDETGQVTHYVAVKQDITARKRLEEEREALLAREQEARRQLLEQDRRMRLAQQATGVGTFEWDIPHNRVTWSPELERLYGLPPGAFGGRYEAWAARVHPEDWPETERQHQRALTTGRLEGEWRVIWPDGTVRWLAGRATVEMDAEGKPLRMLGVNIDITDRKQAEEARRHSEALYHTMARSIPDGAIAVVDPALRYLTVEGELPSRLGLSKESMEGRTVQETLQGELGQLRVEHFRRALAGEPISFETEYHGRTLWSQIVPLRDEGGQVWAAMSLVLDITERKRTELALAVARDQLAADLAAMERLHKLSTRFVTQGDIQTLLDAILEAAITITGAAKGNVQLLDPASGELGIAAQRGFDPVFVEFFSHIRAGQVACGTAMQTRQCVIVEDITLSPLFLEEPRARQLKLVAGMRAITCTPLLTRLGEMVGVLSVHFPTPHRPSDRDLRLLDLLARQAADFIERTQADNALRAAKEDLDQKVQQRTAKLQEALADLEHMSYSMVHDMRAPLRAMQSYATLLQQECAGSGCLRPQSFDFFNRIRQACNRLDQLVTDALNYNKVVRQDLPVTPVELAGLLRGMVHTYPNLQPQAADISIELTELVVLGNESLLTQCFGNLLDNAVKFVTPGVRPRVRVWAEPSTFNHQPSTNISIKDNGIGIPKDQQERIFGMFQRLHRPDEYSGTGIGLTIVRKAVERMGGRICLDSEPGKGTRFCVQLPLAPKHH